MMLQKIKRLNWFSTPSKLLPHGFTGICSVLLGLRITCHHLLGQADLYNEYASIPYSVILFCVFSISNAWAGYKLASKAMKGTQGIFRRCAIFQICLSCHVIRFTPQITHFIRWLRGGTYGFQVVGAVLCILDTLTALATVLCTLSFLQAAREEWHRAKEVSVAVVFGTFGLLLLSTYPVQLVFFGQDWWECVQERYPFQAAGMVGYIYVPTTVIFSLILFGCSLYQRKIISPQGFGIASSIVILGILVSTVLSQEVHIPDVSTQRIYLPCEEPPSGTLEATIVEALDISKYSRIFLSNFLGIDFQQKS